MPYWELALFREKISRHKIRWHDNPFLLCRTVTPLSVREARVFCNCPECYDSRRRNDRFMLSHPLGSFVSPPTDHDTFSRELRGLDTVRCFARRDLQTLLCMIHTNPDIPLSQPSWDIEYLKTWSGPLMRDQIRFLKDRAHLGCSGSFGGIIYHRLDTFSDRKGPRLLRRALRSHSISPFGPKSRLFPIRETFGDYIGRFQNHRNIAFGLIPGTIEYLTVHKCFYRGTKIVFSGPEFTMGDGPPPKRKKLSSMSLVSSGLVMT